MIGSTNDHEDGQEQLEDVEVVEEGPEDVVLRVEGEPVSAGHQLGVVHQVEALHHPGSHAAPQQLEPPRRHVGGG